MTGWHISLGYQSGARFNMSRHAQANLLLSLAMDVADDWQLIMVEAIKCWNQIPFSDEEGVSLRAYAEAFFKREDATISISRMGGNDEHDEDTQIMLLASGGGSSRLIKEELRRAYVRVLLARAHQMGLDINVRVC